MTSSRDKRFSGARGSAAGRLATISVRADAPVLPVASGCDDAGVFALQVLGDAMLPEFEDGDIVVVEPEGRIDDGVFVIAHLDEEWTLRQLRRAAAGWTLVATGGGWSERVIGDLSAIRGVVIQKMKPGRRKTLKHYV